MKPRQLILFIRRMMMSSPPQVDLFLVMIRIMGNHFNLNLITERGYEYECFAKCFRNKSNFI